jgi:hypothetical protein
VAVRRVHAELADGVAPLPEQVQIVDLELEPELRRRAGTRRCGIARGTHT